MGKTQGATQQALQNFYTNDVHPMDRPFFGRLYPCNSLLHCIDFVRTNPIVKISRGPNNDVIVPGMWISVKPFPSFPSFFFPFFFFHAHEACARASWCTGFDHCQIKWDGREDSRSNVIVHDNSTNGTWVRVICSRIPVFDPANPTTALKTRIHTYSLTPIPHVYRSITRASPKENRASCATGTRSRSACRCSSKSRTKTTGSSTGTSRRRS